MANRSAAQSFPFNGFIAIRCGVMSQQLLPSSQPGPYSGGAMTGGSSVEMVTGATSSVIVAVSSGGAGLVRLTTTVCESSCGTAGVLSFAPSMTTSSQTIALWAGRSFVVGSLPPSVRVQYASWLAARESSVLSPALTLTDETVTSCPIALVRRSS